MNRINKIQEIFVEFPLWTKNEERASLLNDKLMTLENNNLGKLVERFLSQNNSTSGICTLYEIHIAFNLLSYKNITAIEYEPAENENTASPDFRVTYKEKTIDIQAKVITSLEKEDIKRNLLKEFKNRFRNAPYSYFIDFWISDDIESCEINEFLEYFKNNLNTFCTDKDYYFKDHEDPIVKFMLKKPKNELSGIHQGVFTFFGEANGLFKEVDKDRRKTKLKKLFDKSSKSFPNEINDNHYNVVFIFPYNVYFHEDIFFESLYGTEIVGFNFGSDYGVHDRLNDGLFNGNSHSKIFGALLTPIGIDLMSKLQGTFCINYKHFNRIKVMPKLFNAMEYCLPKKPTKIYTNKSF